MRKVFVFLCIAWLSACALENEESGAPNVQARAHALTAGDMWEKNLVTGTDVAYPRDFSILSFGNVSSPMHVAGPIGAWGT